MQRRPYSNQDIFPTLMCNNPKCDNISSKLYIVEDKIVEALKRWLDKYKFDYNKITGEKYKTNATMHEKSIAILKKELEKEKTKLTNIYDFFEDGTYTKEMFIERSKSISETINEINSNILKYQEEVKREKVICENKKDIIPKIENVLELYDKLQSDEDKNNLLKGILEKVTYIKTTKAIKKDSDPTEFEITIYPKINKDCGSTIDNIDEQTN